jgi:hypothetical protein
LKEASRFFGSLTLRSRGNRPGNGDFSELHVRRADGRSRTDPARGTEADRASVDPRPVEGRAPGRKKPRRDGTAREGEIPTRGASRRRDQAPAARPRSRKRPVPAPGASVLARSRVPERFGAKGPRGGRVRQSQEGRRTSRGVPIFGRSCPGGRNPVSAPGGDTGETAMGARRRGRQERRGRNVTRRRQLREWWLVAGGLRWGGRKPRESGASFTVRASPGQTLERGRSLREAGPFEKSVAPPRAWEPRGGRNHEAAAPNRWGARARGLAPGGRPTAREDFTAQRCGG